MMIVGDICETQFFAVEKEKLMEPGNCREGFQQ
jgi:hypothetical protein